MGFVINVFLLEISIYKKTRKDKLWIINELKKSCKKIKGYV